MMEEAYVMKATVIECSFGIMAFNEENKLIEKTLFSKKPQETAKTILKIEAGKIVNEVTQLVDRLREKDYETFVFENASLANEVQKKFGVTVEVSKPSEAGETFRSNMERFAVETGFAKNAGEFTLWTHNVTMEMAKLRVKGAVEKRDLMIAQAIQTLDDLDRAINLFMGRVREWYGIHFPELDRLLDKQETYARLVLNLGSKDNFTAEKLEKEEIPKSKTEQIARAAGTSMGADLTETDMVQIQDLCKNVISLYHLRQTLENYLDKAMEEVAPNTRAIVGSLLGARLIALAGGLTNLARRPASTIQVLGAEKALFRSLKTGTRPPKHGIIFQHTYLHEAKRWHRGKIARALAGKLAIAARVDSFGGRYMGEELKADLEKRIEEIREKYVEPPPIPVRKPEKRKEKWRKNRRARKR
jgi:nucleolar protein 56